MSVQTAVDDVKGWTLAPFTSRLNLLDLFLLTGLVIVMVIMWMMILYHIRLASEGL